VDRNFIGLYPVVGFDVSAVEFSFYTAIVSLLYSGYRVFPGIKWLGRGTDHPPPSSAEVKRE
jgi:hypothetical protein